MLETQSRDTLITWYAYPDEEHSEASIVLSRFNMGAEKWPASKTLIHHKEHSLGNPILFQERSGRIHIMYVLLRGAYWNHAFIQKAYSDDNGISWSPSVQAYNKRGMMIRHPPLLLDDESYLLPAYDEVKKQSVLLISKPPYDIWEEHYRFEYENIIQSSIIREKSGRLSLFFRPHSSPRLIFHSFSLNQGRFWSIPKQTPLLNPLSGISAFAANDNIVIVYNPTDKQRRYPLSFSISRDQGQSWEPPAKIDNSELEVSYPSFCIGNYNKVHGVYTHDRKKIQYVQFDASSFF